MILFKRLVLVIFLLLWHIVLLRTKSVKYNFKIATDAPDGSSWIMAFKDIDNEMKKSTNGEVGLTIYPASLMGDQSAVIKD